MNPNFFKKAKSSWLNMAVATGSLFNIGAAQAYTLNRNNYYHKPGQYLSQSINSSHTKLEGIGPLVGGGLNFHQGRYASETALVRGQLVRELIIIDQAVPQKYLFYSQVCPGRDIIELNTSESGLANLLAILARYENLDAVHLVSHAREGVLQLGEEMISKEDFQAHPEIFAVINHAIKPKGDFLFYGCELGKGTEGEDFLEIFQQNTHADLAASDDVTGNPGLEGDWDLEIIVGDIEATPVGDSPALKDFTEILQTVDFTNVSNGATSAGPASQDAEFTVGSYTLEVDGASGSTFRQLISTYYYVVTESGESSMTFSFTNSETFDLASNAWIKTLSGASEAVTITTNLGGSVAATLTSTGAYVTLSSLPTGITSFTITPDDGSADNGIGVWGLALANITPSGVIRLPHTINFETTNGTNLGTEAIDGEGGSDDIDGEQYDFTIINSSGTATSEDVIYQEFGGNYEGLRAAVGPADWRGLSLKSNGGTEFDFNGFSASENDGDAIVFTVLGYRDGSLKGSTTVNHPGFTPTTYTTSDFSNETFGRVDEIRIIANIDASFNLDNFALGTAVSAISRELTTNDDIATDNTGNFYYDFFILSNTSGSSIIVPDLTIEAGSNLQPWVGYWTSNPLPSENWNNGGGSSVYSIAQEIKSGAAGATVTISSFTIPASTDYYLAIATNDYISDGPNLDSYMIYTSADITFTGDDETAPIFDVTPAASNINETSLTLSASIDEAGTIYYVALNDGATAPTSSEIVAGTGSGGAGVVTSGNVEVNTGAFSNDFSISGLSSGTAYDLYVVANDDVSSDVGVPNLMVSPTKVDVLTGTFPITLLDFQGQRLGETIRLNWFTASELNNKGFEIEQSEDGQTFEQIGFVEGAGTSTERQQYEFSVWNPEAAYFRFKQVDIDGQFSYSPTRFIEALEPIQDPVLYPNPVAARLSIGNIADDTRSVIYVVDMQGRQLANFRGDKLEVEEQLNRKMESLPTGIYMIHLRTPDLTFIQKIVRE